MTTQERWAKLTALHTDYFTSKGLHGEMPALDSMAAGFRDPAAPSVMGSEVPASPETERALLGSLLLENRLLDEAESSLSPEDFYLASHRVIYQRMVELHRRGEPADIITLVEELKRHLELEQVGGAAYVAALTDGRLLRDQIAPYLRILRQKSGLRHLLLSSQTLMRQAMLPGATLEECKARFSILFQDRKLNLSSRLRACALGEFLNLEFPPRGMVLDPVIPTQGLAMLYSPRGVGKTYLALGISWAVATGQSFLRWRAPQARKVLFVDGELPASTLQERVAALRRGMPATLCGTATEERQGNADGGGLENQKENLRFITPDLQEHGMPDISTRAGQAMIEDELDDAELLVLDNLSALIRSGNENEGESWLPVAEWALRLRQQKISVLFLHHAGKSGAQRGTSRREDLLDTVIALKRPPDYCPTEGLRCEVRYEKARGFHGDAARPLRSA